MIKAILADLDGVLCDAVELHYISINKALKNICAFELTHDEHFKDLNGLPTKKKLEILTLQERVKLEDHQKIFDLKQQYTIETINEIITLDAEKIELMRYIRFCGLKSVCVTNSIRETALLMLKKCGVLPYLEFVISNEDVKYAKPFSEGYINAMVRLNAFPHEVIIVEDSPHGIQAAKNTGAYVWEVSGPEEVNLENFKKFKESL